MIKKTKTRVTISVENKRLEQLRNMAEEQDTTLSKLLVNSACEIGNMVRTYTYKKK